MGSGRDEACTMVLMSVSRVEKAQKKRVAIPKEQGVY